MEEVCYYFIRGGQIENRLVVAKVEAKTGAGEGSIGRLGLADANYCTQDG